MLSTMSYREDGNGNKQFEPKFMQHKGTEGENTQETGHIHDGEITTTL